MDAPQASDLSAGSRQSRTRASRIRCDASRSGTFPREPQEPATARRHAVARCASPSPRPACGENEIRRGPAEREARERRTRLDDKAEYVPDPPERLDLEAVLGDEPFRA